MGRLAGPGLRLGLLLVLALSLWSCTHGSDGAGVAHTVRRGENLYRIAQYYEVSVSAIVAANRIRDVQALRVGERLWIPGARRSQPSHALLPPPGGSNATRRQTRNDALRNANLSFGWPLRGRLTSGYGRRNGRLHEGIDLAARPGTAIRAAEAGRVIYSGNGLGAYGNVVIVKHNGRYASVYAHNRKNHVRKGHVVNKGDVIAELGKTGNASGPHLHFEIRHDELARDPLQYLP